MNSGVHSSLHPNCHHQIIHAKFNVIIFYPPQYERVVRYYQDANNDLIQRFISYFNWERVFSNKVVNTQISIFNETILNIMTNSIPNETKIFNDWEPPWINNKVKTMIQEKKQKYQTFFIESNQNDSIIVETLLFGSNGLNDEENAWIIESTIEYIITTERFITPLL